MSSKWLIERSEIRILRYPILLADMVGTAISTNLSYFPSSNRSSLPDWTSTILGANYSPDVFKQIVSNFMTKLEYSPPISSNITDVLKTPTYQSLLSHLSAYNGGDKWFEATCLTAASLAEVFNFSTIPHITFKNMRLTASIPWPFPRSETPNR